MLSADIHARIHRVAQVVHAVNLDDIDVLRVEPVAWPRVYFVTAGYAALAQASRRYCGRVADGFAGYDKFYSPVLLPAGRVIVRGYRQSVAETFCAH